MQTLQEKLSRGLFILNSFRYFPPVRLFVVNLAYNSVLISIRLQEFGPLEPASMNFDWWLSLGLGCGIGLLYSITSYLTYRYAQRSEGVRFLRFLLGGMTVRMLAYLSLIVLIVGVVPVHLPVFLCSFLLVFLTGLGIELWQVYRRRILL